MSLKNLLDELVKEGKLKRQDTGVDYLNSLLEAAKRNFEAAALVKGKVDEAAFKLVYDGLLQIGRLILLLNGYCPDDGEQHKTTFLVAGELLGKEYNYMLMHFTQVPTICSISGYGRLPENSYGI